MTRASVLRAALVATVAALLSSLLVAFPGAAASAAPDPGDDHFWLPKRCVGDEPGRYVPDVPGPCYLTPFKKHRPTVVLWGDSHAWQLGRRRKRAAVQRRPTERGVERFYSRNGNPAERDVMRRADEDDTLNILCAPFQSGERCGGDLSGVAVTGMRCDDSFWTPAQRRLGAAARSWTTSDRSRSGSAG